MFGAAFVAWVRRCRHPSICLSIRPSIPAAPTAGCASGLARLEQWFLAGSDTSAVCARWFFSLAFSLLLSAFSLGFSAGFFASENPRSLWSPPLHLSPPPPFLSFFHFSHFLYSPFTYFSLYYLSCPPLHSFNPSRARAYKLTPSLPVMWSKLFVAPAISMVTIRGVLRVVVDPTHRPTYCCSCWRYVLTTWAWLLIYDCFWFKKNSDTLKCLNGENGPRAWAQIVVGFSGFWKMASVFRAALPGRSVVVFSPLWSGVLAVSCALETTVTLQKWVPALQGWPVAVQWRWLWPPVQTEVVRKRGLHVVNIGNSCFSPC